MFRKIFSSIFILVFILTACNFAWTSNTSGPIALTDGLGREVTLAGPAKRIISLAPSNTEILFAIGAGSQVVGRDETSDYPSEATAIPSIGGWAGFNTESIVALQPDLVLGMAGDFNTPELAASLEQSGLTVYYLRNPTTIEEMFTNIETVGKLTGHTSEAESLVKSLQKRVKAVDDKLTGLAKHPLVFFELDASDPARPYTTGPGTFIDGMITRAGGENAGNGLAGAWAQISIEELLVLNPEIIILADSNYGVTPEQVTQRTGWETIQAVQDGNVFPVDDNLIVRPGPRLVDGLEALAELLHPDIFK